METNMALNVRNLSLASQTNDSNILCTCPMSYNNLKHCQKLISKDKNLEKRFRKILNEIGRPYDISPEINHISDAFLAHKKRFVDKIIKPISHVKAVTHHGCHYSKFFFKEVRSGTFENPTVLNEILESLEFEVLDYDEQFLCCGGGLHRSVIERDYPREILRRKLASIAQAQPDIIITQCPGCTFNLEYYQESLINEFIIDHEIPVLYISELLAILLGAHPADIGMDMHVIDVEPFLKTIGILE